MKSHVWCAVAMASWALLAQTAHAETNLGNLSGYQVKAVGGDLDTSAFPDITAVAGNTYQGQPSTKIGQSPCTDLMMASPAQMCSASSSSR